MPQTGRSSAHDADAFAALAEPYRRELQVHCYRMLGSYEDSEDLVQAEGPSSFRAWLYRIATNACIDALAKRPRRVMPHDVVPASDPEVVPPEEPDVPWLQPYPDRLLASSDDEPDAVVVERETIELAFIAAIQHLPPRQRAALLLRDVLGFSAKEAASLLQTSVAAANSALQRARTTLRERLPRRRLDWAPSSEPSEQERALVQRYIDAQQRGDAAAVDAVLREDVRASFPPHPLWYDSREAFHKAVERHAAPGEYRFVPTGANMQPAIAAYLRSPGDTVFRPLVLEVLRIGDGQIAEIIDFGQLELFAAFGLPAEL